MSNERKEVELPNIEIDADLLAKFQALEDAANTNPFNPEKDKLLMMFWPVKNHQKVAELLGVCTNTCLKRYRQLTNDNSRP